jgi:putative polyketide hydroxylase
MSAVEVLVIGGGPVGLTAAALLGDLGIETLLVDRNASTSTHPRAFGIHPRTMEVWRRLGAADAVRQVAVPPDHTAGIGWLTSLSGTEVGRLMFPPPPPVDITPEQGCFCAQHRYTAVLRDAAEARPSVTVRFGTEATVLGDGQVQLIDTTTGRTEVLQAQYVIAADGLSSPTRSHLGVSESGTGVFGHSVNVFFRAELAHLRENRPFALTWTVGPGAEGTFAAVSADLREWTFNLEGERDRHYSEAELVEAVRRGVGDPTLDLELLDVLRWDYEQAVTDTWRVGSTFLCGDSAHRFPPHGGFGMNSGVQDAENLAWKLAAVLRWGADKSLLDSYQAERKPVAELNSARALVNTRALADADWDPARAQASVEAQVEHFFTLGQQMGAVYESAAVVDDGRPAERSTITEYVETGCPGARAPHLDLRGQDGALVSTIDLCRGTFVVLQDGPASGVLVQWVPMGPSIRYDEVNRSWRELYGVDQGGGVLIRPDGHVAARWSVSDQRENPVRSALHQVLGMPATDHLAR